jgi:predicted nicotinamide N-methyase
MKKEEMAEFIRSQTVLAKAPIVPEIELYLATEITPIWQITEERLKGGDLPPPYWAFAWPGGQGLARYVLDHPEAIKGERALDFGAGGGIAAIAAAKAGAKISLADDIDLLAQTAILLNAGHNGAKVDIHRVADMERAIKNVDLILAGDVCYNLAMSTVVLRWLHLCVAAGVRVLIADPGRAYVPKEDVIEVARYEVPTSRELEDRDSRTVIVWELQNADAR